jgi:endonuclease/exonuclease/phosphatase family metal-dependent hydrolase
MSYNVFNGIVDYDDGTTTGPISYRQQLQLELIKTYAPDIIGFNEYSKNYDEFDSMMTGLGYVKAANNSSIRNNNPIFYNAKRLELVASGYRIYESVDASKVVDESKAAAWAVFNVKETNKKFIVISTHFMWNSPKITDEEAEQARRLNATELVELVSEIRSAGYGDIPVIMGGDLNSTSQKDSISIIKNAGYTCAWDAAAVKNNTNGHHTYSRYNTEFNTYSTIYSPSKKHAAAIDHMFVSSGITVNSFASITLPYTLCASDHCPTITDFAIN